MTEELARELLRDMSRRVESQLIRFGVALEADGGMVDGWPYFLERSEKWADEYTRWVNAGEPEVVSSV